MRIKQIIEEKIRQALSPLSLEVINESGKHRGHAGDDGSGESHFKLIIVSQAFDGMPLLARQRLVHEVLKDELKQIHALSLDLKASKK